MTRLTEPLTEEQNMRNYLGQKFYGRTDGPDLSDPAVLDQELVDYRGMIELRKLIDSVHRNAPQPPAYVTVHRSQDHFAD